MFQKKYVDEDVWEEVTEGKVMYSLDTEYNDIPAVIKSMKEDGFVVRLPFAFYRWIEATKA